MTRKQRFLLKRGALGPKSNFHLGARAYIEPALPDRTAFVLEHQSSSSLGNERVETDGDQRWTASQALAGGERAEAVVFQIQQSIKQNLGLPPFDRASSLLPSSGILS